MTTVQRVEPVDTLFREEGSLLLYERELVRVSPIGEEIFAVTAEPMTVEGLAAHLTSLFGSPEGDAVEATRVAVEQLLAKGVLREVE